MTFRRFLFWLHLCVGSVAGIFIMSMCVSGLLLNFRRQITDYADAAGRPPVTPGEARLPVSQLLGGVPGGHEQLSTVTIYADHSRPSAFSFGRERTVFVDPYTGKLLGENSRKAAAFFEWVERWHRRLGGELRGNGWGRDVVHAVSLSLFVLLVSGVVLWWPRVWSAQRLRATTLLRRGLTGRPALWNYHNALGVWCLVPLLSISMTGVIMSYSWATNLLYRMAGENPPQERAGRPEGQAKGGQSKAGRPHEASFAKFDKLFEIAEAKEPGWRSVTLRLTPNMRNMVFTIDKGNGGQPDKRAQLTLNSETGAIRSWEPFETYSTGRRLRMWARFLHTGEALGLPGQAVVALGALGGIVLAITGLAMAWKRLVVFRGKSRFAVANASGSGQAPAEILSSSLIDDDSEAVLSRPRK